jgi:hypothetical protein
METERDPSFYEQVERIRNEASTETLRDRIAAMRQQIEHRRHEEEIALIAERRRDAIAERGVESILQRIMDNERS